MMTDTDTNSINQFQSLISDEQTKMWTKSKDHKHILLTLCSVWQDELLGQTECLSECCAQQFLCLARAK